MSFDSWKRDHLDSPGCAWSSLDAEATLWDGFTSSALFQHGMVMKSRIDPASGLTHHYVRTQEPGKGIFVVDHTSRPLCMEYLDVSANHPDKTVNARCQDCPLALARGGVSCMTNRREESMPPYQVFQMTGDIAPMRAWLALAVATGE